MKNRTKAICAASGLIAGAGALGGAVLMNDLFGYDVVGWIAIPIWFIFTVLIFYWTREDAIRQ